MLQQGDGLRRPGMFLAAQPEGEIAADVERIAEHERVAVGHCVALHRLLRDLLHANAADGAVGAGEITLKQSVGQTDGVEDLRAAIGLVR